MVKVIFNIPQDELNDLITVAQDTNMTVTELIRRAIKDEIFLRGVVKRKEKLLIQESNGAIYHVQHDWG